MPLAHWIEIITGESTVKAKRHALAYRREIVGHTQETLAEFVGVEPTTVGRWERGETSPQPWSRPKLAEALAISVEQLTPIFAQRVRPPGWVSGSRSGVVGRPTRGR